MTNQSYSVIGYACGLGGTVPGSEGGPTVLRNLKLIERLKKLGVQVTDLGDTSPQVPEAELAQLSAKVFGEEQRAKNLLPVFVACRDLARLTQKALENNTTPIILGGDHSFSIGSVAAVSNFYAAKKQRTGLIWIDSHPDLNTPDTSYSQNIYGMSVAVLLGRLPGLLASIQTHKPAIDLRNFCYIGLRDVDPPEREVIKSLNISAFTMKDIDLHGLPRILERAIAIASDGTAGFVASFDLDVCDPPIVPGVGFPVRGGFTYREAELVWELLYDSRKLRSIELVELNPTLDRNQVTAELGISLLESAVGKSIL